MTNPITVACRNLIRTLGKTITLINPNDGAYNPVTGIVGAGASVIKEVKAIIENADASKLNIEVMDGDVSIMFAADDFTPSVETLALIDQGGRYKAISKPLIHAYDDLVAYQLIMRLIAADDLTLPEIELFEGLSNRDLWFYNQDNV